MEKKKDNNKTLKLFVVIEFITTLLVTCLLVIVVLVSNKQKDKSYNTASKAYDKIATLLKQEVNVEFDQLISFNYKDQEVNLSYKSTTNLYNFILKNVDTDLDTFISDIAKDNFSLNTYQLDFVSYTLDNFSKELIYKEYNYQSFIIGSETYYSYTYFNSKDKKYGSVSYDSDINSSKKIENIASKNSVYEYFLKIALDKDKN